ncbi:MAG: hypothetical protein ACREL1_06550 [bacterium]
MKREHLVWIFFVYAFLFAAGRWPAWKELKTALAEPSPIHLGMEAADSGSGTLRTAEDRVGPSGENPGEDWMKAKSQENPPWAAEDEDKTQS